MTVGEAQRLPIAARIRPHRRLRHHTACRCGDDRERVLVAVRVNADHVVHLLPSIRTILRLVGSGTPVWSRETARQVCDESRPEGGQAPDQANSGRQAGVAVHVRTIHSEGTATA